MNAVQPALSMEDSISALVPEEAIRERAYELYERRGRQDGADQEDWLQAEIALREQLSARQESYTTVELTE